MQKHVYQNSLNPVFQEILYFHLGAHSENFSGELFFRPPRLLGEIIPTPLSLESLLDIFLKSVWSTELVNFNGVQIDDFEPRGP